MLVQTNTGSAMHGVPAQRRPDLASGGQARAGTRQKRMPDTYAVTLAPSRHTPRSRGQVFSSVPAARRTFRKHTIQGQVISLLVLAVCLLHAPRAGADVQRVVSSPDLTGMMRSWRFDKLPPRDKKRLIETPEMRLNHHLDSLKAAMHPHVAFEFATEGMRLVALPDESSPQVDMNIAQNGQADLIKNSGCKALDHRCMLLDADLLSTVTPEPSDSMPQFSECQPSEIDKSFREQYLQVQRSIAMGKSRTKTSIVCFDFDRTLSEEHVHRMTEASRTGLTTQEAIAAFGGHRRIQQLTAFLRELQEAGAAIHIISLGHKRDIMATLATVGLDRQFPAERIIGCDEIRRLQLVTKAQCTGYVASLYGLRRQDVLLVDDDYEQLLECSDSPDANMPTGEQETCGTFWVRSGRGLTYSDMAAISGMARSRQMTVLHGTARLISQ